MEESRFSTLTASLGLYAALVKIQSLDTKGTLRDARSGDTPEELSKRS